MVKPRTIVAMVTQNKLRPRKYQRPGRGGAPISLFDPAEVEALRQVRVEAKTEVLPASAPGPVIASTALARRVDHGPATATAAALMEAQYREALRKDKYLTLAEAAALTKLSQTEIHERLKDQARRGAGGWNVYPREAVEQL